MFVDDDEMIFERACELPGFRPVGRGKCIGKFAERLKAGIFQRKVRQRIGQRMIA